MLKLATHPQLLVSLSELSLLESEQNLVLLCLLSKYGLISLAVLHQLVLGDMFM